MLAWIARLLGEAPIPQPVLLRVRDRQGTPLDEVSLSVTWRPCGSTERRRTRTAQGLCLVAWRQGARAVSVAVEAPGSGSASVELGAGHDGGALDVQLG